MPLEAEETDHIIYPIGFKKGRWAKLQLPRDLTQEEAEKIARIVVAMAAPVLRPVETSTTGDLQ